MKFRKFYKNALCCLPLFGLFLLLNPALMLINDPEPGIFDPRFWLTMLLISMAAALASGGLLTALPNRPQTVGRRFFGCLFVLFFLTTVFYPEGGRRLDGGVAAEISTGRLIMIYAVYIAVFFLLWRVSVKYINVVSRVFAACCILSLLVVGYTAGRQIIYSGDLKSQVSLESLDLSFAKKKNVMIILADMLQGSSVEQVFALDPDLADIYKGFIIYSRASSPFPFTAYGLPAVLSGQTYTDGPQNYLENLTALKHNSLLADSDDQGYETILLSPGSDRLPEVHKNAFTHDDIVGPPATPASLMMLPTLGLRRIFKHNIQLGGLGDFIQSSEVTTMIQKKIGSLRMMENISEQTIGQTDYKTFFIHTVTPHAPTYFDKNGDPLYKNTGAWRKYQTPDLYLDEVRYFLRSLAGLFDRMKTLGLYDESLVIVVADHGHLKGDSRDLYADFPGAEDFAGYEAGFARRHASMYNPALLIKPPHSEGGHIISRAPMSNTAIRAVVNSYIKGAAVIDSLKELEEKYLADGFEIVVFTQEDKHPYWYVDRHIPLKFSGNISALPHMLRQDDMLKIADQTVDVVESEFETIQLYGLYVNPKDPWFSSQPGLAKVVITARPKRLFLNIAGTPYIKPGLIDQQKLLVKVNDKVVDSLIFTPSQREFFIELPLDLIDSNGLLYFALIPQDVDAQKDNPRRLTLYNLTMRLMGENYFRHRFTFRQDDDLSQKPALEGYWKPMTSPARGEEVWLMDQPASMELNVGEPIKPAQNETSLVLTAGPLGIKPPEYVEAKRVQIVANGEMLGELSIDKHGEYSLPISPDVLNARDSLRLDFIPLNPTNPKKMGLADYDASVSIFITEIKLVRGE